MSTTRNWTTVAESKYTWEQDALNFVRRRDAHSGELVAESASAEWEWFSELGLNVVEFVPILGF